FGDDRSQSFCQRQDLVLVLPFYHHADHGLGTRSPQDHPAGLGQLAFDFCDRVLYRRRGAEVQAALRAYVQHLLRVFLHSPREFRKRLAAALHDREDLQRRDQTVARGGLVEADHMTGGFPADDPAGGPQRLVHVPVAELGPDEFDACIEQGMLEPEIAHYRAHYRTLEAAFFLAGARQDEEQLVAIDDIADLVDHHDAIAVAIERDTHMCLDCGHGLLQQRRIRRAATGVDIRAVWRTAYRDYLGTEFTQRTGPDLVTRSIGAVE